jgi:hypothetical protein
LSSDAFLFSFANHCNGNLANCWHAASLAYVLELHPARFGDRTRLGGLLLLLKWWYIYIYIFIYILFQTLVSEIWISVDFICPGK